MNSEQAARVPASRMIGGVLLAIILGLTVPIVTVYQLTLLPLLGGKPALLLGCVFMAFLHGWSGWVPTAAFMVVSLLSAASLDFTAMWIMIACMILPGIAIIGGMMRKRPFFGQLRLALAACGAGLLLAIFIAYRAFGADMIAKLMDFVRSQFTAMPDAMLSDLVEYVNQMMRAMVPAQQGVTIEAMTVAEFREAMDAALVATQQTYVERMPACLIGGAVWTAVLSTLLGNWRMAKRGIATSESYQGISRWFLPPRATAGVLALLAVGYILTGSGQGSGMTLWNACAALAGAAFTIQGLASLDRIFVRRGASTGGRRLRVILIFIVSQLFSMAGLALQVYGAASALFGSQGAVTKLRKKLEDDSDGGSD